MSKQLVTRHGGPKRFSYRGPNGRPIRDDETLDYIRGLVIPPAWQNVEINPSRRARILATGYDAAGRKQYLYHPNFRQKQEQKKFDRLIEFAQALPRMRRTTTAHLRHKTLTREKVLACMVRLIDQAYFRVGNERYAKENQTYGLTTMRSRHLKVEGDTLIFEFVGKSHQEHYKEVQDPKLARIVRELDELPGYEIFKYYNDAGQLVDVKSQDLNAYIKEVMGGDFSAKDFRTWAGTLIAAIALSDSPSDCTEAKAKREVSAAVKHVAEHLGNTPTIARSSYIDPRVINHYLGGQTIKTYLKRVQRYLAQPEVEHFSPEEICVLKLLQRKLAKAAN